MIKNYMYSDGTAITATIAKGILTFAGGDSVDVQPLNWDDIKEVSQGAAVAADQAFTRTINITGTPTEGDVVTITIQSPDSRQNRRDVYKVYVHTGDTLTSVAAALSAQINADNTSAAASPAVGVITLTSATEQLVVTVGSSGVIAIGIGTITPATDNLELITSAAYFLAKDGVTLGAAASYAVTYLSVNGRIAQTYSGDRIENDVVAIYTPTAQMAPITAGLTIVAGEEVDVLTKI